MPDNSQTNDDRLTARPHLTRKDEDEAVRKAGAAPARDEAEGDEREKEPAATPAE